MWQEVVGERALAPFLLCGEIKLASYEALRAHLPGRALFAGGLQSTRHASVLARLARQRLESGSEDSALSLEPLYLRRPSITTSTRKQPLFGDKAQLQQSQTATEREEGALRH